MERAKHGGQPARWAARFPYSKISGRRPVTLVVLAIANTGSPRTRTQDAQAYGTRTRWLVVDRGITIVRHSETARCNAFCLLGL